jgi:hypothetical protein
VDALSMTMAELMREVAGLTSEQKDELAAYLLHLRLIQDREWRSEMARRIDSRDPKAWVTLADWKKELAQSTEP